MLKRKYIIAIILFLYYAVLVRGITVNTNVTFTPRGFADYITNETSTANEIRFNETCVFFDDVSYCESSGVHYVVFSTTTTTTLLPPDFEIQSWGIEWITINWSFG